MKKIIFCSLVFSYTYVVSMYENKMYSKLPVVEVHKKLSNLDAEYTVKSIATDDSIDSYSQDALNFKAINRGGATMHFYEGILPLRMQRDSSDDWDWSFYKPRFTVKKKYTKADLRLYGMFNPEEERQQLQKLQNILATVHESIRAFGRVKADEKL